jgi:hypothetical protein
MKNERREGGSEQKVKEEHMSKKGEEAISMTYLLEKKRSR